MRQVLFALLLIFLSTWRGDTALVRTSGPVILVTIDTLRADHLGMFGYARNTSPFLDSLAANGISFTRAMASSSHTAPSHASMFTSLHPAQHGVLSNGQTLAKSFVTLAGMFKVQGYETAAFTSINFLRGLKQGFDSFNSARPEQTNARKFRPAELTVAEAIEWLADASRSPKTFLWVHLYDVHEALPEIKSERLLNYLNRVKAQPHRLDFIRFLTRSQGYHRSLRQKSKLLAIIDRYDAQILHVDTEIRRLYNAAQAIEGFHNSTWVITSDHGEGLGNHNYLGHGAYIYQEQLHVPLIFHFPDKRYGARVVPNLVRHVDLMPTLAALMNWQPQRQVFPVEGMSLAPLIHRQTPFPGNGYAFAQRRPADKGWRSDWTRGEVYSLQTSRYKYIEHTEGEDEFYDLQNDPFELNNMTDEHREKTKLRNTLAEMHGKFVKQAKQSSSGPTAVEEEYMDELKALGYLN